MSFTAGGASINLARRVETPLDACCCGYQNRTKRIVKPNEARSLKPASRRPQKYRRNMSRPYRQFKI